MTKEKRITKKTKDELSNLFLEVLTEYGGPDKELNRYAAIELTKGVVTEALRQQKLTGLDPNLVCNATMKIIRNGQVEKAMDLAKSDSVNIH
ncbi:TPA: hypothetical protein ACYEOW_003645 [Raoultella terrigena]